jgi:hypothetical protein
MPTSSQPLFTWPDFGSAFAAAIITTPGIFLFAMGFGAAAAVKG